MKHFFEPLFEPVGATWLLMAIIIVALSLRRAWRCAACLAIPTALLFLLGSTPMAEALVGSAEERYATNSPVHLPVDVVVALGGTQRASAHDVHGFSFGPAEERIIAAVETVRSTQAQALVLGGSTQSVPGKPGTPTMALIQDWLVASRMVTVSVTNLGICANTHDEAVQFCRLQHQAGWQNVLLVTSALHMRRAEATFRKQGVHVQPVACNFRVCGVPHGGWFYSLFPSQHRLELASLYLHEQIGWWVYQWRGWL
jgi:uncharacterized SAM-binding protein YcdF (DUF218 family)